jgi:SAM-dependent methyltransferase
MAWYKKTFGKEYLRIYSARNDEAAAREVDFLLKALSPPKNAWFLDVGCGAGRHAFALARRGYENVAALDLSEELLAVAKERARRENLPVMLARGDMRRLPFQECFDVVISMFTSFGYFDEDAENALALSSTARALKKGGRFALDLPNKHHVEMNLVAESLNKYANYHMVQKRALSKDAKRVEKETIVFPYSEESARSYFESVRLYTQNEISRMLKGVGLRAERFAGNFDGDAMSVTNPRMIVLGRKANAN